MELGLKWLHWFISGMVVLILFLGGCAGRGPGVSVENSDTFPIGAIICTGQEREVTFEEMIDDLVTARIVYVGESHTNPAHHAFQLEILKALHQRHPDMAVGMEMFAQPYQEVLSRWSTGLLSEERFLALTHWYANWRHDFSLYRDQLLYIREHGIPLVALNLEFHIPSRIAAGGLDSLLPYQAEQIPDRVDLTNSRHREFVRNAYDSHGKHVRGRYDFEDFYAAQVVWDEAMAEAVARSIDRRVMIVFAGRGHIAYYFGIPERAHHRTGLEYRTVLPQMAGETIDFSVADYLWISEPHRQHGH